MPSISEYMLADHKVCDETFARAEDAIKDRDWMAAETGFKAFRKLLNRHIAMEEDILFSALDHEMGTGSPTEIFRSEHVQMCALMDEMHGAMAAHDADRYLGDAETLMASLLQHNMKEENMLYPTMDESLASQAAELIARCNALE